MLKTCLYCGSAFDAIRSTRKYCSDNCKSKYHQLDKEIETDASNAMEMLFRLSAKALKYPDKQAEIFGHATDIAKKSVRLRNAIQADIIKRAAGN